MTPEQSAKFEAWWKDDGEEFAEAQNNEVSEYDDHREIAKAAWLDSDSFAALSQPTPSGGPVPREAG